MRKYTPSKLEKIFGGDFWFLRTLSRRIISILFCLIPTSAWRQKVRDILDNFIIETNKDKIDYFVENYPAVKDELDTISRIVTGNRSITRFGDGEFNLCLGRSIGFQKADKVLVKRLKEVLSSNNDGLLVGINTVKSGKEISTLWQKFIIRRGNRVLQLLDSEREYDSSTITTDFPDKIEEIDKYVGQLKKIWENRKVLFIVGEGGRFFYEKDLFGHIREHEFLYGPSKHAFSKYDEILKNITSFDKDWLIMISLGPTATVLAYDLFHLGYQVIDLGHTPSKYHRARYGTLYPENNE